MHLQNFSYFVLYLIDAHYVHHQYFLHVVLYKLYIIIISVSYDMKCSNLFIFIFFLSHNVIILMVVNLYSTAKLRELETIRYAPWHGSASWHF
jgi:hypothetical protein